MPDTRSDLTDSACLSMPKLPSELWMFWNGNNWIVSIDEAPGGETYLVAFTEGEAMNAAEYQTALYDELPCTPVRVFPR